jgi:hypothetical protein
MSRHIFVVATGVSAVIAVLVAVAVARALDLHSGLAVILDVSARSKVVFLTSTALGTKSVKFIRLQILSHDLFYIHCYAPFSFGSGQVSGMRGHLPIIRPHPSHGCDL